MGQVKRFATRSRWGLMDYIATMACAITVLSFVAGGVEGKLFPVLDPTLTVSEISVTPDGDSRIAGSAVKVRGVCKYVPGSLKWYWGNRSQAHVLVPAHFIDKPQERPGGLTSWSGIIVSLAPNEIRTNSYATVQHRCHWFWKTESVFYESGRVTQ